MAQGFSRTKPVIAGDGIASIFVNGVKQDTTSGSTITFTIPSGVKNIKLLFDQVSMSTTASHRIRIGDSGGVETTGYETTAHFLQVSGQGDSTTTTHFGYAGTWAAAHAFSGIMDIALLDSASNTWVATGIFGSLDTTNTNYLVAGSKALSGELTTVEISASAGTFDLGSINVQYDNPNPQVNTSESGRVLQVVQHADGEAASGTTLIPNDDTIPQNTEGTEFMTASITPTSAASKLRIDVVFYGSANNNGRIIHAALFQDSTADALAAAGTGYYSTANIPSTITFTHWMDAGTTSSTTFKVRAGADAASTTQFNSGASGARRMGGVAASSITITEYAA